MPEKFASILLGAGLALGSSVAFAQVPIESELSLYDQPMHLEHFFNGDGAAAPGVGRVLVAGLTADEEVALYNRPQRPVPQGPRPVFDPQATGSLAIGLSRARTPADLTPLYRPN